MAQNTSSAVMQQRSEPHDSLDFFPTPPWATRSLCEWMIAHDFLHRGDKKFTACEPACGKGHMARPLAEYFNLVMASDVHPYGFGGVEDFLLPFEPSIAYHWIITNPPFKLGLQFALKAISLARIGAAMLVRTAFLEGGERHRELFAPHPPFAVLQFCERVPMVKGRYDPGASTATSYCWIVWMKSSANSLAAASRAPTSFHWIAPCRARLQKPEDAAMAKSTPARLALV